MKFIYSLTVLASLTAPLAKAENQCADLTSLLDSPKGDVSSLYVPRPVAPASTLKEALAVAERLHVKRAASFLRFSDEEQLRYLNDVNVSVSSYPPILLLIVEKAGFEVVLVKDALRTVPEIARTGGAYAYAGVTIGSEFRKSYVVVNYPKTTATAGHIAMHELGHALSHSIGIIRARVEKDISESAVYPVYTRNASDFDAPFEADRDIVRGSPFDSVNEFFPETLTLYFDPAMHERLRQRGPHLFQFWERWFGDACRAGR